jgi:hypothetical protein
LKKDFGLSNFAIVRTKIFTDFKTSIDYYLRNKNYDVKSSLFGKPAEIRFEDCDVYDFKTMIGDIQGILNNCIDYNLQSLKKRDITIKSIPKEFAITELKKQIQDNIKSFSTYSETKRNVYSPDGSVAVFNDVDTGFTEQAEEHKSFNFIRLDNGQFAAQPNNRCLWYDQSLISAEPMFPDFQASKHIWTVDGSRKWSAGDDWFYDIGERT